MRRAVLALIVYAAACSDHGPGVPLPGSYTLIAVNRQPLPYTLHAADGSSIATIQSGTLDIRDNGTFTITDTHIPAGGSSPIISQGEGMWSVQEGQMKFTSLTGDIWAHATMEDGDVLFDAQLALFTFRRR
jgi:hypothetical protein